MYSYEIVLKAIELFKIYKSKKRVSKILGISRTTIIKWINKYYYKPTNLIKLINTTFKPIEKKINIKNKNKIKDYIIQLYTLNPFYTRKQIQNLIFINFNLKLGFKKLRKIIASLNFTYKKAKYLTIKNKEYIEKLKKERIDFESKINLIDPNKIISIDECGFNSLYSSNLKGHSIKGTQINIPINEKKFKNNTLLMALSTSTIINHEIHLNKINNIIFKNFIETTIKNNNLVGYVFLFDNVSFHKNSEMLNLIKKSNNNYMFTPPYSPNNNPIENMFGIIKHEFTKQIIDDIINKNILSKKEFKLLKVNKKMKLVKISNEKIKEKKEELTNELTNNLLLIKNSEKKLKKKELNELIKKEKKKKKKELKNLIKEEKNNIKNELKKEDASNIIKTYINKTIETIKKKYKHENIIKIFIHAFNYDYKDIEKEIRDRIVFLRN